MEKYVLVFAAFFFCILQMAVSVDTYLFNIRAH